MFLSCLDLGAWDSPLDYKIGDTAQEDILAPVQLVVIDQEETTALKKIEARKIPVICRYYTNTIEQVETEFRSILASTRSNFLDAVEAAFNVRELDEPKLSSPKFQRLALSFRRQNKSFPISTNLARVWASAKSDAALQDSLAAALRGAMVRPIRAFSLPEGIKLGYMVRIVSLSSSNQPLDLDIAERAGARVRSTNVLILKAVKTRFEEDFSLEDKPMGRFLASLIKPNCVLDVELTRQSQARRIDPLYVADRYEAGQIIVKQGQVVDRKIRAALDQLREKTAIISLQEQVRQDRVKAGQMELRNRWIVAGAVLFCLALVPVFARVVRRKPRPSLLPAPVSRDDSGALVLSCPSCSETIVVPPETVVIANETRQKLLPHLVRFLKEKFVRKLMSERSDLLGAQEKAAADIAELEERLARIHAPLKERLHAYEQRIQDLEKELAQKGEENRELIKAKIQVTREHMEAAKEWVELN